MRPRMVRSICILRFSVKILVYSVNCKVSRLAVNRTVHLSGNPCKTHQIKPQGANVTQSMGPPATRPKSPMWPLCCFPVPQLHPPPCPIPQPCTAPAVRKLLVCAPSWCSMSRFAPAAAPSAASWQAFGPRLTDLTSGSLTPSAVVGPICQLAMSPSAPAWTVVAFVLVRVSLNDPGFSARRA